MRDDGQPAAAQVDDQGIAVQRRFGQRPQVAGGPGVEYDQLVVRQNIEILAVRLDGIAFVDALFLDIGGGECSAAGGSRREKSDGAGAARIPWSSKLSR